MSLMGAKMDLLGLDIAIGRGRDTVVEVSKALIVAQLNGGVEARVLCKNGRQMIDAHAILMGEKSGVTWNDAEEVYELPNGSAIRVTVDFEHLKSAAVSRRQEPKP
jgi:hypothetical protein